MGRLKLQRLALIQLLLDSGGPEAMPCLDQVNEENAGEVTVLPSIPFAPVPVDLLPRAWNVGIYKAPI
jgi:hypothetical protein